MLSQRGQRMSAGALAPYIEAHAAHRDDEGYVCLSIAENDQVFDLLQPKLQHPPPVPQHVTGYDDMAGKQDLRAAVADLFEREIFGRPVNPDHVRVLSGASGVLEALALALGDPGDGVLIPTPTYSGFWPDLEVRAGLRIIPAVTSAADGFRTTPEILQQALDTAEVPVKALVLTNPDNPRGQIMSAEDVCALLAWAEANDLHVIADEVYALSVFGERSGPFPSVGRLCTGLGQNVHVVWAVSKDLGMSGLRCGVLISENQALLATMDLQGMWSGVSGHTQHVLAGMLGDRDWLNDYLCQMRQRLSAASQRTMLALERAGIPYLTPEAAFFLLCDLRGFLDEPTWAAEHGLWQRILDDAQVNLTPGSACRVGEPGWFRVCYASNPSTVVSEAIERLGRVLTA